jgi:hypothetical protein
VRKYRGRKKVKLSENVSLKRNKTHLSELFSKNSNEKIIFPSFQTFGTHRYVSGVHLNISSKLPLKSRL